MLRSVAISDRYRAPVRMALGFSVSAAVLAMLALDLGEAARSTAGGLIVFWAWVLMAIAQRPECPAPFDLILIRWGSIPLVVGFYTVMQAVWHLRT